MERQEEVFLPDGSQGSRREDQTTGHSRYLAVQPKPRAALISIWTSTTVITLPPSRKSTAGITPIAALRRAIAQAPNWYKPHLLLAQLLRITGPASEADAESSTALDLSGAMRPTVEAALRGGQTP